MRKYILSLCLSVVFIVSMLSLATTAQSQALSVTGGRLNVIFAEDTSDDYVKQVYKDLGSPIAPTFYFSNHWNPVLTATNDGTSTAQGESLTLTWSIIPDGTTMSDTYSGTCTSSLIADLNAAYGVGNWQTEIANVFADWSSKTGNQYVHEPNDDGASWPYTYGQSGVRGDLRIGGCSIDGNFGVLAYNYYPSNGDMKIDSKDSYYNGNLTTTFHNVISHEHGHGAGIAHVCPVNQTKLMEPFVTSAFTGLQHDDIRANQRGYGDYNELIGGFGNDTAAQATSLGLPSNGVPEEMQDVSIDDDSDQDWYSFSVDAGTQVDVTVSPVGHTYLNGPQNSDGSCTAGTSIDSSAIHNLNVQVIDSDGTTVLAAGNGSPAGASETLNDILLGSAGTKYIRVYGDTADDIQLYNLEMTVEIAAQDQNSYLLWTK